MKLILVAALSAAAFGQEAKTTAPPPITDPKERLLLFDMFAEYDQHEEKRQEVLAKIESSDLGKQRAKLNDELKALGAKIDAGSLGQELTEVQKQMSDIGKTFDEKSKPILESHGCKGGQIDRKLKLLNCPTAPAK